MSSAAAATMNLVEHVVFFKLKEEAPAQKKWDMVRELNKLKSLDGVLHLKAGPTLQIWPSGFTHVLHSRHKDKAGLSSYRVHPAHVQVVQQFVQPISEDVLAMDWEAIVETPLEQDSDKFDAKRIVACKLKDGATDEEKAGLLEAIGGGSSKSAGMNFSPDRAKGFNFGLLSFFRSKSELQSPEKLKTNPCVEDVIVLDYVSGGEQSSAKI